MLVLVRSCLRWIAAQWRVAVLAGTMLGIGGGAALVCRERGELPSHQYCNEIENRFGVPSCVGEVPGVRGRGVTYHLVRVDGRVTKLESLNGHGALVDRPAGASAWEYTYDADGALEAVAAHDRHGKGYQIREPFAGGTRVGFRTSDGLLRPDGQVETFTFDWRGCVVREGRLTTDGVPVADALHAFGYAYERDGRGVAHSQTAFGADGRPTTTIDGWSRVVAIRGRRGEYLERRAYDVHGRPVEVRAGWAVERIRYDPNDNAIETMYLGADGKPAVNVNGVSAVRVAYDADGDAVHEEHLGRDGAPTANIHGCMAVATDHDEQGDPVEITCLDEQDRAILSVHGVAIERRQYRARRVVAETYFGVAGERVENRYGVSRIAREWSADGELLVESFFDAEDRPTPGEDGYATVRSLLGAGGYLIGRDYLGVDGKPVLIKDGYAGYRTEVDSRGRALAIHHLGTNGAPTLSANEYATERIERDEAGNPVRSEYFDCDDRPTLRRGGYHRAQRRFDTAGRELEVAYFGIDGGPVLSAATGCHRIVDAVDAYGSVTERRCLDEHDAAMGDANGVSRRVSTFVGRDLQTEALFDAHGRPRRSSEGFASKRIAYDASHRPIVVEYRDEHGAWLSGERNTYDSRGRRIRNTRVDAEGRDQMGPGGYATVVTTYDDRGCVIAEASLDAAGAPVARTEDGLARTEMVCDSRRRVLELRQFGLPPPAPPLNAVPLTRSTYDVVGHLIAKTTFDAAGSARAVDGCAGHRYAYDTRGRMLEDRCVDGTGAFVARTSTGAAVESYRYDLRGNTIELRFSDGTQPVDGRRGFATRVTAYDARNKEVSRAYRNRVGQLVVVQPDGFARMEASYDASGLLIEQRHFGDDDKPIDAATGFARARTRVDADRRAHLELYGADGTWLATMTTSTLVGTYAPRGVEVNPHARLAPVLRELVFLTAARNQLERTRHLHRELLAGARGLLVKRVLAEGQASRIGVQPGDVLIAYGETVLDRYDDLITGISRNRAERTRLRIVRGAEPLELAVSPGRLGIEIDE
jgi:hypothetical protein